MQQFLDSFFLYDSFPPVIQKLGTSFGFDTACLCSFPNFFVFVLYFVLAILIVAALGKAAVGDRKFLLVLLSGVLFSGLSKMIDWTQNMFTATGETVFWSNNFDIAVELLQLVGTALILWALFVKLRQWYGNRASTTSSSL